MTSQTPATKRVFASKLAAQRTKQAREAQRLLAVANAFFIIAELPTAVQSAENAG